MPINDSNASIIKQFKNCSHFYVEIVAKFRQTDINIIVEVSILNEVMLTYVNAVGQISCFNVKSFQSIANFLKANGGEFLLKEQEQLKCLAKRSKTKLIELLVLYIYENYTMYPNIEDFILVCNATVNLFDKLKDEQGGIVSKCSI